MPVADHSLTDFFRALQESLSRDCCWGVVLCQPTVERADSDDGFLSKWTARPIELSGQRCYQVSERRGQQEFHQNIAADELEKRLATELGARFRQAELFTSQADWSVRMQSDGTANVVRRRASKTAPQFEHDRRKQYLIPEGRPCAFLAEIGVMTAAGQVRSAMQAKFRQVNRFLEFVDDVLPELPKTGRLRVIDFGCGKSYLTFALHYLLTELRSREVEIVGLDLKAEVVRDCQHIAEKLGCRGLRFEIGDIASHSPPGPVDLSVSLHACDTATDAAIAQAVCWQAKVILAVPCCQHEVANLMPTDVLPGLLRHGILKERFAALATDALRAQFLESIGYRTQVIEFIDLEHTPKNLLLRAVRTTADDVIEARQRFEVLKTQLGLETFALEKLFPN